MITVKFKENHKEKSLSLEISGHAGYADAGKDIVCSAASILAYTLAQEIMFMDGDHKLAKEPKLLLEGGNTSIVCKPKQEFYTEILGVFQVISTGYRLLMSNHPNNVILVWETA